MKEGGAGGRAQPIRGTRPFFGVSQARRWGDAAAPGKGRASRGERPARSGPDSQPCPRCRRAQRSFLLPVPRRSRRHGRESRACRSLTPARPPRYRGGCSGGLRGDSGAG